MGKEPLFLFGMLECDKKQAAACTLALVLGPRQTMALATLDAMTDAAVGSMAGAQPDPVVVMLTRGYGM